MFSDISMASASEERERQRLLHMLDEVPSDDAVDESLDGEIDAVEENPHISDTEYSEESSEDGDDSQPVQLPQRK